MILTDLINCKIYRIYTDVPYRYAIGNMGITWKDGKLIGAIRCTTNISLEGHPYFFDISKNNHTQFLNSSITKIGYLDLKDEEIVKLEGKTLNIGDNYKGMFRGLEDGRLVVWNDNLYIYGTQFSDEDPIAQSITIYKLDDNFEVVDKDSLTTNCGWTEKNWMAFPDKPMDFIYKLDVDSDRKIYSLIYSQLDESSDLNSISNFRGSTPLLKTDDGYISIVHQSYRDGSNNLNYVHNIARFDDEGHFIGSSPNFRFEIAGIEFCTGMTRDDEDNLYISYSTSDGTSNIIKTTLKDLTGSFVSSKFNKPHDLKEIADALFIPSPITASQYYWAAWKRTHDRDALYSHYAILLYYMDRYLLPNELKELDGDDSVDAIILKSLLYRRVHAPYKKFSEEVSKLTPGWWDRITNKHILKFNHHKFI